MVRELIELLYYYPYSSPLRNPIKDKKKTHIDIEQSRNSSTNS